MRIPQHNTNLRGRRALLRELADLIDDLFGRDFEPGGRGTGVGDRAGRDAFAVAVEATHDLRILVELSIDFVGFRARSLGLRDSVVVGAKSCASGGFSECEFLASKTFCNFLTVLTFSFTENVMKKVFSDWMLQLCQLIYLKKNISCRRNPFAQKSSSLGSTQTFYATSSS